MHQEDPRVGLRQRFALTRYFSIASVICVIVIAALLGASYQHLALRDLRQLAEGRNVALTHSLANALWPRLAKLVAGSEAASPEALRAMATGDHLYQLVADQMAGTAVVKVKIYALDGKTVFSSAPAQTGESQSGNPAFRAAQAGQVTSGLTHRDTFDAFEQTLSDLDVISTYLPIRDAHQRMVAVFEIYSDVTPLMARLHQTQVLVIGIVLGLLGLLYALLYVIVARAQRLIDRQEMLLEQSIRELDQRVLERTESLRATNLNLLSEIEERRQAVQALHQSEARLRCLSEMSSDFYWESDIEHRLTQRTESKREVAEGVFLQSSPVGKRRWELAHLTPSEAGWRAHRAQLEAHVPFRDFEISRRGAKGSLHHISVSGDPVFDSAGHFTGYHGVGTDITDRKQAEAELRIAASAFESQVGMMVTDAQCVILRVNRAFSEITGYSEAELLGQTPRLLQSGRHDAGFYRAMWDTIHMVGGWQGEIWDRRKNGEIHPKWLAISNVKDDDGVVTHYIGAHYDISERKLAEEKINALAFFDQLTGLPNRTLLLDRLQQAMTASHRSGSFGAVLFIDLDHFKTINDTLGHERGDQLLQQVAQRLSANVREGDSVARLGGDEFVVVLGSLSECADEAASQTETIGEKIRAALSGPYLLRDIEYTSAASLGATLFTGHQTSLDDLLKQADLAMYQSKANGRNALRFFDPSMQTAVLARATLEDDLRRALEGKPFVLYYQAQVGGDGDVTGVEALIRWQHPRRGMVSPAEFIPVAEESGLIVPLGQWVLETACSQLATWASRPAMAHLTMAVNVSAHQFSQADFVQRVLAVIQATGANPYRLKLELTESLLVHNVQEVIDKMLALKARGVGFSLDDFGTGYSSLSYLKRLPLDQLKIDQGFVRDILIDPNDAAIAKMVIVLADSLGLAVIAEGVETEAQRDFLADHGCRAYQGYLFSRPLQIPEFERWVCDRLEVEPA